MSMKKTVRVRFAPSPTGYLHVGGARTALMNYLFARHHEGKFILRIEDTDIARSSRESEEKLLDALLWLGLEWDEGPKMGGPYGPYRQSERLELYREYARELVKDGKAYPVYASPEEIDEVRTKLLTEGKPPHFSESDFARFTSESRRKEYERTGKEPVIMFKMPRKEYKLMDLIKGKITFKEGAIGDFVILRSNGLPTYNFACVVDDHDMEITHVIRGDDHLSNTLRQLAIYEAFEWTPPKFAHVSMILAPDGSKLSKRHGATSVEEFRAMGMLPEAMVNYLALLGWSHPEGKEIMSLEEMVKVFDLDRVHSSPAIFDVNKLKWMNGVYMRNGDLDRLTKLAIPFVVSYGLLERKEAEANFKWLKKAIESVRNSVETLAEIPEKLDVYFEEVQPDEELFEEIRKKNLKPVFVEIKYALEDLQKWEEKEIVRCFKEVLKNFKVPKKDFYMTLRLLLTGRQEGPELVKVVYLLGRARVLERLARIEER